VLPFPFPATSRRGKAEPQLANSFIFFGIARGSLYEVETQIHIAERLRLISKEQTSDVLKRFKDVVRMLNALMNALPKRS